MKHPRRRTSKHSGAIALYLLAAIGCTLSGYLFGSSTSTSSAAAADATSSVRFLFEHEEAASSLEAEHGEEGGEHGEGSGEGLDFEEAFSLTDLRTIVSIVFALILLTVSFETVKEHLEESTPEDMEIILEKLFGELTVLGFLSMVTFMVSKTGLFEELSKKIFEGEQDELLEYVEYVYRIVVVFPVCCF